jgi:diphosphomevalonate decarboxylase
LNIPAVDSLSVTLESYWTETTVAPSNDLDADSLVINGEQKDAGSTYERVADFMEIVRERAGKQIFCHIESESNVPVGIGLASSASGFAALTRAAVEAFGLELSKTEMSEIARIGSGSAARSIFGGFVFLSTAETSEESVARQVAEPDEWPLECLTVILDSSEKEVSSTDGMIRTARTSPFYEEWLEFARQNAADIESAVRQKAFRQLARLAEKSMSAMHGCSLAAQPPLMYWNRRTQQIVRRVGEWRDDGLQAFSTVDAGPNVHIICKPEHREQLLGRLNEFGEAASISVSEIGAGARIVNGE